MFHLHVRYIAKTTGASALQTMSYIARLGRHRNKADKVREVIAMNMPEWASEEFGAAYWQAADSTKNRANARLGYSVEYGLPKALTIVAQRELAVKFAMEVSNLSVGAPASHGAVPLTIAIHEGFGRNPHVHMLLSTSIADGVRRAPGAWFMRYNPAKAERGGAKRSRVMAKSGWLLSVRELWANLANNALAAAGFVAKLDHRANSKRGKLSEPAVHLGPSAAHLMRQGKPAPRVSRFAMSQIRNAALEELQNRLEDCRRRLRELEIEEIDAERSRQAWLAEDQRLWNQILMDHPLCSQAPDRVQFATAFVVETDRANQPLIYNASRGRAYAKLVEDVIGTGWDTVRTDAGLWLIKPGSENVVFMGAGYGATDGEDLQSIDALILAARLLPYKSASVRARESVLDLAANCLQRLQVDWSIRPIRGAAIRSLLRPR